MSSIHESRELLQILSEGAEETGKRLEDVVKEFIVTHGGAYNEKAAGGTKSFDIMITDPVIFSKENMGRQGNKIPRIAPGNYEVKMLNPDGTLARLGSEKIRNVLQDDFIASIAQLGMALSKNRSGIKSLLGQETAGLYKYFFEPETKKKSRKAKKDQESESAGLTLDNALRALELNSNRLDMLFSKEFASNLNKLRMAIITPLSQNKRSKLKIAINTKDGTAVDTFDNISMLDYESNIKPSIAKASSSPKYAGVQSVLPFIVNVLEERNRVNIDSWKRKLAVLASGPDIKGYFGVDIHDDIYYFPNHPKHLKAESLTQGGRLVIMTSDGIDYGKIKGFKPRGHINFSIETIGKVIGDIAANRDSDGSKEKLRRLRDLAGDDLKGVKVDDILNTVTSDQKLRDMTVEKYIEFLKTNKPFAKVTSKASTDDQEPKNEMSMGGVAGVTTPIGTGPDGGKGGPAAKRKGRRGESTLDRNARTQGRGFGNAKRVDEASTVPGTIGNFGPAPMDGLDIDGDGDTDIRNDTKRSKRSIYRGGDGDLEHNAAQIGRHFAGAEPIDDAFELLQILASGEDLTPSQQSRFKRPAQVHEPKKFWKSYKGRIGESVLRPSTLAALQGVDPKILDENHVKYILGLRPLPLNEGPIDADHLRLLIREQLIYEGWWDSAKQFLGQGIDKIKEKADDIEDAVKNFGRNTKGVVAALWMAVTDTGMLGDLLQNTRRDMKRGVNTHFLKPLRKLVKKFEGVSDIPKKIAEKIESGFEKFMEGMSSPGWKGLLTSMAAFLGYRWAAEEFYKLLNGAVEDAEGNNPTVELAKQLGDKLTGGLISKVQEKLQGLMKEFTASAVEQIAGPLAWIKKIGEFLGGVDWVTSNLIGIVTKATFKVGQTNG